ncbi:hypothetical protein B0H66DRAFT_583699 [Apodospora peruviana]|uniref:Glucan 1, 4-alpha-glucosidase n=1 Tax=Apodospora peruviana TaxID=516989 RepID=A0AAE0M132_9PEZI|nr:hypothetical protein B0H66DRAFT_583699 [Apodospora peruviana]
MSTPSPTSPPKRPRLSLQIKAIANGPTGRTSRSLAAAVDVKSPTSFNTLSNVYATAVDRSTPLSEHPPPNALTGGSKPSLRLQTQAQDAAISKERRLATPYLGPYLETPLTAQPMSPAIPRQVYFPSAMTATPPMSAVPPEQEGSRVFTFETQATPLSATPARILQQSSQPKRARTMPANALDLPYTHPRSLRSILRNSPLPPLNTKSPESPRRQSVRLQEKAARRVAYNSPLCQTITTSKYTRSHIDLLAEDATPTTPSVSDEDVLDQTMAYTGNETRDGGQTPGPFEEMRRRMASLRASTPTTLSPTSSGGIRKRGGKKKEKKRRWVWTIGQDGEDADEVGSPVTSRTLALQIPMSATTPVAPAPIIQVMPAQQQQQQDSSIPPPLLVRMITPEPVLPGVEPPTPSVESVTSMSQADSVFEQEDDEAMGGDVEMSDVSSMFSDDAGGGGAKAAPPLQQFVSLDTSMAEDMDMMDMSDNATPTATTAVKTVGEFGPVEIQGLRSVGFAN